MNLKLQKLCRDAGQLLVGIKGTQAIQQLYSSIVLQDNSTNCVRTPAGSTNFGQYYITPKRIKSQENLCQIPLEQKWMGQYLSKGQLYTELLFAQDIMSDKANRIAQANEILMWQGDTAYTGVTANLNLFDGFLKQIKSASATTLGSVSGATMVEKMQSVFLGTAPVVRSQSDFVFWVGADVFAEYTMAETAKNIFRQPTDFSILGIPNSKFIVVDGLNATRNVVAGRMRDFYAGTDLLDEQEKALMTYSVETTNIYLDYYYSLGVTLAYPQEVTIASV